MSAHRTPDHLFRYAEDGAGPRASGSSSRAPAARPTCRGCSRRRRILPVIGVPIPTQHLGGLDSLLSIVQMPRGIPVATVAIGNAKNAALLAVEILALSDPASPPGSTPGARTRPRMVLDDPTNASPL